MGRWICGRIRPLSIYSRQTAGGSKKTKIQSCGCQRFRSRVGMQVNCLRGQKSHAPSIFLIADFLTSNVLRPPNWSIARRRSEGIFGFGRWRTGESDNTTCECGRSFLWLVCRVNPQPKSRRCLKVQATGGTYRRSRLLARKFDSIELGSVNHLIVSCGLK